MISKQIFLKTFVFIVNCYWTIIVSPKNVQFTSAQLYSFHHPKPHTKNWCERLIELEIEIYRGKAIIPKLYAPIPERIEERIIEPCVYYLCSPPWIKQAMPNRTRIRGFPRSDFFLLFDPHSLRGLSSHRIDQKVRTQKRKQDIWWTQKSATSVPKS